jgi:PIN domain nuclease of toxin-antitoxin system
MKYLLDTHVLLWVLAAPERLSAEALLALEDRSSTFWFSQVSLWEAVLKESVRAGSLPMNAADIAPLAKKSNIAELVIRNAHILRLAQMPTPGEIAGHKDPFDRLLMSQAACEGMTLLSHDRRLAAYPGGHVRVV